MSLPSGKNETCEARCRARKGIEGKNYEMRDSG